MATSKKNEDISQKAENGATLDIAQFFSRDNENNGAWFEPEINGRKCGFEFLVCGVNSNTASIADEKWNKQKSEVKSIQDPQERAKKDDEIFSERIASFILDIRGKDKKRLVANGREVTKDDIPLIIYNSPALAVEVSKFAGTLENFLGQEKND